MNVRSTFPSSSNASTVTFQEYGPKFHSLLTSIGGGGWSRSDERGLPYLRFLDTRGANRNLTTVDITFVKFSSFN